MSCHRVTLQFDLEITDEERASAAAAEIMRALTLRAEANGGRAETGGESPEVAMHGLAQNPEAAALVLAPELLVQGASLLPWVTVSNIEGRSGAPED